MVNNVTAELKSCQMKGQWYYPQPFNLSGLSWHKKIKSQQYVAMKKLSDNMALHSQLDDLPSQTALAQHALTGCLRWSPPVTSIVLFLAYVAVRTSKEQEHALLCSASAP